VRSSSHTQRREPFHLPPVQYTTTLGTVCATTTSHSGTNHYSRSILVDSDL
jgi:hypothetical protein